MEEGRGRVETARRRGLAGRHNLSAQSSALSLIPRSLDNVLGDSGGSWFLLCTSVFPSVKPDAWAA